MGNRRFEAVAAYAGRISLPERKTAGSAGYDLAAAVSVTVPPGKVVLVPTGVKAYMGEGEVLLLYIRSSLAVKRGLILSNGVGVVDSDYADNPDNEGHILVALANIGAQAQEISAGERIAQGVFTTFLTTENDQALGIRSGGFGSTGKQAGDQS